MCIRDRMVSAFNMLVIRTYMNGIPDSLEESAQLDGAGSVSYTHLDVYKRQVIYAGHGDLVDDINGNWYVVMLASRPCKKHSSMGRETFIAKTIWENE